MNNFDWLIVLENTEWFYQKEKTGREKENVSIRNNKTILSFHFENPSSKKKLTFIFFYAMPAKTKRIRPDSDDEESAKDVKWPSADTKVLVDFKSKNELMLLLEGIAHLLSECTFHIAHGASSEFSQSQLSSSTLQDDKNRGQFSGFYIEAMDTTLSCIIIAKISADVSINAKNNPLDASDMSFCLPVGTFLTHVKSINANHGVQLYRTTKSADLFMRTYSLMSEMHHSRRMTLGTLNKSSPTFKVSDMNYPHTIEIELNEFRTIIKTAKAINCPNIRIRIMETKAKSAKHCSFFIIHVYGENSYDEHCFCCVSSVSEETKQDGADTRKTIVIRNDLVDEDFTKVTRDQLDEKFNNIFAVEYLNSFLKALERHTVTLRLAQDQPLTITSSLGNTESFLAYFLAPKTDITTVPDFIQSFGCE
jgi:hypothetical protein